MEGRETQDWVGMGVEKVKVGLGGWRVRRFGVIAGTVQWGGGKDNARIGSESECFRSGRILVDGDAAIVAAGLGV